MKSLKQSLAKVGMQPPFTIPGGFQACPPSILKLVQILNSPTPDLDNLDHKMVYDFSEENAQGIAYAYTDIWFLSSEKNLFKYSIKGPDLFSPTVRRLKKKGLSTLIAASDIDVTGHNFDHIGGISWFEGLLFASIRDGGSKKAHIVLALNLNLDLVGYSWLAQGTADSWCCVDPWDRLLYMTTEESARYFITYDVSEYYRVLSQPGQWGKEVPITLTARKFFFYKQDGSPDEVTSVQSASFSPNGRLYVAWYVGHTTWWTNHIRVYHALTRRRLDDREYDFADAYDEIEGITVHPSGYLYVAVTDNDVSDSDEFEIHAFKYRDTTQPM
jgi:hypothetical protein